MRSRSSALDWRAPLTGALCLGSLLAGIVATAFVAIAQYGWVFGLLIGWAAGPFVGGAVALVVFLWLLPLQQKAAPMSSHGLPRRRETVRKPRTSAPAKAAASVS